MARPLRLELAGALYHITSRGDGREDIFLSDDDRVAWLDTLAQVCKRFNWVCHAYCQMTNHRAKATDHAFFRSYRVRNNRA